jgi:CubicO group peptidase (beta-lactamase class C family)
VNPRYLNKSKNFNQYEKNRRLAGKQPLMKSFVLKSIFLINCLLVNVYFLFAQNLPAELDNLFQQQMSDPQLHFNGTVLVAEKGKIIYQNAAGYANIFLQQKNSLQTRYQLASLSKVFTAVAIMQLVEKKSIQLDDPIKKYLPSFPYADITIRQILSHTSGLPDFNEVYHEKSKHALTNSDIIPALIQFGPLTTKPGAAWHYSSMGYALLANLVEKITGQTFPDFVQEYICKPAGMLHSYVLSPYIQHDDSLRAINYVSNGPVPLAGSDSLRTILESPWQTIIGPGLMVSSASDLLLFSEALFANKILNVTTQEEMYTVVKLPDGNNVKLEHAPIYQALGWGVDIDQSSGQIVSHNGGSMGISTILLRNLKTHQTVIVLENTDNMAILAYGVNAMNILCGKPVRQFGPPH